MMKFLVTLLTLFWLVGCSQSAKESAMAPTSMMKAVSAEDSTAPSSMPEASATTTPAMIAYEHTLHVDVPESDVAVLYTKAQSLCKNGECAILESNVDTGESYQGSLKLRAKPAKIDAIIKALSAQGEVVNHSISGEDLALPISDATKKLSMLQTYRDSLETLLKRPNVDIDSLIKINQQLAQVQSDIESLSGEKTHLELRVKTEILNILIVSETNRSFYAPIQHTLSAFKSTLAAGISALIATIAFVLPFGLVVWLGRKGWSVFKREKKVL